MGEIKTKPVKAQHIPDRENFRQDGVGLVPGSFRLSEDTDGALTFWYCCPCGCGVLGTLLVGKGFKPEQQPSWKWNGDTDAPTLEPSVHHVGHWHGHLQNGVWVSC